VIGARGRWDNKGKHAEPYEWFFYFDQKSFLLQWVTVIHDGCIGGRAGTVIPR